MSTCISGFPSTIDTLMPDRHRVLDPASLETFALPSCFSAATCFRELHRYLIHLRPLSNLVETDHEFIKDWSHHVEGKINN